MSKTMPLFLFVAEMWENIFLWWHTQVDQWVESCTSYLRRLHFVWSGFNWSISHFTIGGFSPVSGRSKRRCSDDRCLEILNFRPCTSKSKELMVHTPPQVVNHTISMPHHHFSATVNAMIFVFLAPSRFSSPKGASRRRCATQGGSCFKHNLVCSVGFFHR
jgi:hypothetical protein